MPVARFIIVDDGTIAQSRDDTGARPRKRQRVEDDQELESPQEHPENNCPAASNGPGIRDPDFYFDRPSADCIVRVQSTIFKLESKLLAQCSCDFDDMLNRRSRREEPLTLFVSADDFHALVWALYASPRERAAASQEHRNIDRLLSIANITQIYHCTSLHSWSLATIQRMISDDSVFIETCSSSIFSRIVDLAIQSEQSDLLSVAIANWSIRVRLQNIPSVPAILAADRYDLPALRGVAYYTHILEMIEHQTSNGITERGATQFHADPKLSNAQVMRLLSGHWSLVNFWERLRRNPPKLVCVEGCPNKTRHGACEEVWRARWDAAAASRKVLNFSSANVLGILACMHDLLGADKDLAKSVGARCKVTALDALQHTREELDKGMADHFFGCI